MARKRNNRQVLVSRGGRQQNRSNQSRNINQFRSNRPPRNNLQNTNRNKPSGMLIFMIIIALIAFVIGAGVGVSLSIEKEDDNSEPVFQNVTEKMVINITNNTVSSNSTSIQNSSSNASSTSTQNSSNAHHNIIYV